MLDRYVDAERDLLCGQLCCRQAIWRKSGGDERVRPNQI
jgi:hypothetical protein